jgi:hypothetical protein
MVDPLTVAALGSAALVEGIRFLYDQAGELLKRRREVASRQEDAGQPMMGRVQAEVPAALGGGRLEVDADLRVVARNERRMAELQRRLANYADASDIDQGDGELLPTMLELRDLVEEAIGRHLTFSVERDRPPTGNLLAVGHVRAGRVRDAEATGIDVDELTAGVVRGEVVVDAAEQGAKLTGARFGRIGPKSPGQELRQ